MNHEDIQTYGIKADKAILSSDLRIIEQCIDENNVFLNTLKKHLDKQAICYFLANLWDKKSLLQEEEISGWRNGNYPECLVNSVNYYRQALEYGESEAFFEISTNLGNGLSRFQRGLESIALWPCNFDLRGDSPFVSSFSKYQTLIYLAHYLNDPSHADYYQYEAFKIIKNLKALAPKISHPIIKKEISTNKEITDFFLYGEKAFSDHWSLKRFGEKPTYGKEESMYRRWCLDNTLFLNHINDVSNDWIADQDIVQFPDHFVDGGDGPFLAAAFSSIIREYCFARHLAYEGIHKLHPEYENNNMYLIDTLDSVTYDGNIEKIKASLRIAFSLFDSLYNLMARYFLKRKAESGFTKRDFIRDFKDIENPFIDSFKWNRIKLGMNIPYFFEYFGSIPLFFNTHEQFFKYISMSTN